MPTDTPLKKKNDALIKITTCVHLTMTLKRPTDQNSLQERRQRRLEFPAEFCLSFQAGKTGKLALTKGTYRRRTKTCQHESSFAASD